MKNVSHTDNDHGHKDMIRAPSYDIIQQPPWAIFVLKKV